MQKGDIMGVLSIIGFLTIIIIVLLLISGRVTPIIALVLTPISGAFIAGFGLEEIGAFFDEGITDVVHVAIMFIFAILFFGIMQDVGLFDPLIRGMISISQGNVIAICIGVL
jgi:citrate-Mg2+:H+ or citrate-Ca2+:H+ symporter, CitMHS family